MELSQISQSQIWQNHGENDETAGTVSHRLTNVHHKSRWDWCTWREKTNYVVWLPILNPSWRPPLWTWISLQFPVRDHRNGRPSSKSPAKYRSNESYLQIMFIHQGAPPPGVFSVPPLVEIVFSPVLRLHPWHREECGVIPQPLIGQYLIQLRSDEENWNWSDAGQGSQYVLLPRIVVEAFVLNSVFYTQSHHLAWVRIPVLTSYWTFPCST